MGKGFRIILRKKSDRENPDPSSPWLDKMADELGKSSDAEKLQKDKIQKLADKALALVDDLAATQRELLEAGGKLLEDHNELVAVRKTVVELMGRATDQPIRDYLMQQTKLGSVDQNGVAGMTFCDEHLNISIAKVPAVCVKKEQQEETKKEDGTDNSAQ